MKLRLGIGITAVCALGLNGWADDLQKRPPANITVYNQNFAVVREPLHLELKGGINDVRFSETTAHVEPDSVILRDPAGKRRLQILEQNYRNDPVSQELLLSLCEGQTIDFQTEKDKVVRGRIVRSGYVPHMQAWEQYGYEYSARQTAISAAGGGVPIIEVDGKLRFGLPGQPIFPSLGDDTILKPTLTWRIETDTAGPLDAELGYVTGGMSWKADYNLIAPETGDTVDLIGWVTMDNQTGKTFENARIKLMAGDVKKIQPQQNRAYLLGMAGRALAESSMAAPVSEKSFDEYHLYSLHNATTLRDRETKQVEFVRAAGVPSKRVYVYEGAFIDFNRYNGWGEDAIRQDPGYGTTSNPKVWVMREFENKAAGGLGIPLPAGRTRFYRQDADGRIEFVGENNIDHTPKDETVRVYTGNAFDIVGERVRTKFNVDNGARWVDEEFDLKIRNHKKEPVDVRIVERLYRWSNWEVRGATQEYSRQNSQTIEFQVRIEPDGEAKLHYGVHYTW